jgi:ABC-type antimicrobial peptide transport system permease subunit
MESTVRVVLATGAVATVREIVVLVGVGIAIGVPVTLAGRRLVSHMLFGLRGTDAASLVMAVLILLAVGLVAGYLPARRRATLSGAG